MRFNIDQQHFIDSIIQFVKTNQSGLVLLNAPAGTGKTTCIYRLYDMLSELEKTVTVMAPTHKATTLFHYPIKAKTIHSYFAQRPDYTQSGDMRFFHTRECLSCYHSFKDETDKHTHLIACKPVSITPKSILFVDEASMIDIEMINYFLRCARSNLVIFCCDHFQIPPINYPVSPIFQLTQYLDTFTFTEQMRAKTDGVRLYCDKFRESITLKRHVPTDKVDLGFIVDAFEQKKDAVVISWTNSAKDTLNDAIRERLFARPGTILKDYYVDEQLVFSGFKDCRFEYTLYDHIINDCSLELGMFKLEPYVSTILTDLFKLVRLYVDCDASYYSSSIVVIQDLSEIELSIPMCSGRKKSERIRFHCIRDENKAVFLKPIKEHTKVLEKIFKSYKQLILAQVNSRCKEERNALWRNYYIVTNLLNSQLDYSYSITCHKAQGSQWHTVIANTTNLRRAPNGLGDKLCYTAVSRATTDIYFI